MRQYVSGEWSAPLKVLPEDWRPNDVPAQQVAVLARSLTAWV